MHTQIAHLTAAALAVATLFGMQNASANVGALSVSGHAGGMILERGTTPGAVRNRHVAQAGRVMLEKASTTSKGEGHVASGMILERERSPGAARDGDGHIAGTVMLENAPATVKGEEHVAGSVMLEKTPTTVRDEAEHVAGGMVLENAPAATQDGDNVVAIWVQ